jgi:hypothetical protein
MPQMSKVELFAAIRRESRAGMSARAIAGKYKVSRRTVRAALQSAWPQPRKSLPPRVSKLDAFKPVIDDILRTDLDTPRKQRHTVKLRPGREADLLRLAHQFTAGQIRAGMVPIVPGPLNPLLLLGPDALRVQAVALRLREPVPLLLRFSPEEPASLFVSCSGCGEPVHAMGEVKWLSRDDRGVEFDDGYTGTLTGDCPACGSAARVEVRLSQSTHRLAQTRELSWDAVS